MDSTRTSLQQYVFRKARQGDIQNVVDVIDHYGWTKQWMMNVGDRKGRILDQALQNRRPKTVLELGKTNMNFDFRLISSIIFI